MVLVAEGGDFQAASRLAEGPAPSVGKSSSESDSSMASISACSRFLGMASSSFRALPEP